MLKKCRIHVLAVFGLILAIERPVYSDSFIETFSSPPESSGWRTFGNKELFSWDSTNRNLRVTWDSSQPNSYFYRPLGTVLAKDDDFTLEFDLRLNDIATGLKRGPFEIAIGLINIADATRSDFWRGSGINTLHGPRNIMEFDYFPAGYYDGWGAVEASASPTLVSKDNGFASSFTLLELTNGALFHVTLAFTATNQSLRTTLACNGQAFRPVDDVVLGAAFSDFRLDSLAIASYSDAGDDFDSVLAHGTIDNISLTIPAPPVSGLAGRFSGGAWQAEFVGRSNWLYVLEKTTDFSTWSAVSEGIPFKTPVTVLEDRTPLLNDAFYRVRAERP